MAVHPFPLELFIQGVKHLNRIKAAAPNLKKTENNQLAVFALNNLMEDAGMDLSAFLAALYSAKESVRVSSEFLHPKNVNLTVGLKPE